MKMDEDFDIFPPTLFRVVRVFRVGRVLRLVKSAKGIRTLLFSLAVSLPALFNIGLLLFLVMFIYAIFGMSFFKDVKHEYGINNMYNFETFGCSITVLFQMCTSAGWDGVLAGLMNDNSTKGECSPAIYRNSTDGRSQILVKESDCGNSALAKIYLVTYLIMTFLVVINMYIAVILENFSQATEDVQQGLTQDDFDMYYEVWERFDEKATEYIDLDKLSEFVDNLEEPLRIPQPNYYKLVSLDIPICENERVHCVDILEALTRNFLGTTSDNTNDMCDFKKGPSMLTYVVVSSTLKRQREIVCCRIIQRRWRNIVRLRQAIARTQQQYLQQQQQLHPETIINIDAADNNDDAYRELDDSEHVQLINSDDNYEDDNDANDSNAVSNVAAAAAVAGCVMPVELHSYSGSVA